MAITGFELSSTLPFIVSNTVGFVAFEPTEIVFLKGITLLVSYLTSISPFSPGKIGCSGFFGIVQPHEALTLVIISGESPVLVNLKTLTPSA